MSDTVPFELPAYPYDRLNPLRSLADRMEGGLVDCSIGTPIDPPPEAVLEALADADRDGASRGYPPSIGTAPLREAISRWLETTFGAQLDPGNIGACVGTKEFVAGAPHWLRLRQPSKDTVLYPEVAYPTYAMGAELAGIRPVPVPVDAQDHLLLELIDPSDAARALMLWVNSPGNPAGGVDDLAAIGAWGAERGIPVFSDECYAEFSWSGSPQTILGHGSGTSGMEGVIALHSLSKRSNLAGLRVGWYSGDPQLVRWLQEIRKHAGFMVPGAAQLAAVAALSDTRHVTAQRDRYRRRLRRMAQVAECLGGKVEMPEGGFYLWVDVGQGRAWEWTETAARELGLIVSPGEFYGAVDDHVRIAVVQPDERIELVAARAGLPG